jgi:hypothetical protein
MGGGSGRVVESPVTDAFLPYYARSALGGSLYWDDRGVVLDASPGREPPRDPWKASSRRAKKLPWRELGDLSPSLVWPDFIFQHRKRGIVPQIYLAELSRRATFLPVSEVALHTAWERHVEAFWDAAVKAVPGVLRDGGFRSGAPDVFERVPAMPGEAREARAGVYRSAELPSERIVRRFEGSRGSSALGLIASAFGRRRTGAWLNGLAHPAEVVLGESHIYATAGVARARYPRQTLRGFVEMERAGVVTVHRWLFGRHAFLSLDRRLSEALLGAMGLEAPRMQRETRELTFREAG